MISPCNFPQCILCNESMSSLLEIKSSHLIVKFNSITLLITITHKVTIDKFSYNLKANEILQPHLNTISESCGLYFTCMPHTGECSILVFLTIIVIRAIIAVNNLCLYNYVEFRHC